METGLLHRQGHHQAAQVHHVRTLHNIKELIEYISEQMYSILGHTISSSVIVFIVMIFALYLYIYIHGPQKHYDRNPYKSVHRIAQYISCWNDDNGVQRGGGVLFPISI